MRCTPRNLPARQRGVALIMAVLIVALATMLAISIASEGYMDQRRTSTIMVMDQAYAVALGAEAMAARTLQEDSTKVDSLDEAWATPIALPLEDGIGEVKGSLEDLQGRFNLNTLLNRDGSPNATAVRQFQRLLSLLGIDQRYATLTLDWIDDNSNPEFPDGAEDSTYAGQTPAYQAANLPITRTSELLAIAGMTQADYVKLEPHIATLPLDSKLNVCTASAYVLDSLTGTIINFSSDAATFAKNRSNSGCFPKITDVKTAFAQQDADFDKLMVARPDYLVETTSYFRANILVTIGTTELALYSVLNRGTGANARTRVIQRSFGTT